MKMFGIFRILKSWMRAVQRLDFLRLKRQSLNEKYFEILSRMKGKILVCMGSSFHLQPYINAFNLGN